MYHPFVYKNLLYATPEKVYLDSKLKYNSARIITSSQFISRLLNHSETLSDIKPATNIALDLKYKGLVESEVKTSTVRANRRDYSLGAAQFTFKDWSVLPIYIQSMTYKPFGSLNTVDAHNDGFNNLEELKEALLSFYDLKPNDEVTIVNFNIFNNLTECK